MSDSTLHEEIEHSWRVPGYKKTALKQDGFLQQYHVIIR